MSVVYSSNNAVIIDHEAWLAKTYGFLKQNVESEEGYHLNNFQQLFDLRTPFLMDGQAEKIAKKMEGTLEDMGPSKKKKKINDLPVDQNSEQCAELDYILEVFTALHLLPDFKKFYSYSPSSEDFRNNNKRIRDVRKRFSEMIAKQPVPLQGSTSHNNETVALNGNTYILPPNVEYICDDVKNILNYTSEVKYDLIVIDPPWWNKHVRRQNNAHGSHHGYKMMTVADIMQIPLGEILSEEGLIIIWCTNNKTQINEVKENLHKWGVDLVATWYWLKLTRGGEPITTLSARSHGKKPYEQMMLARRNCQNPSCPVVPDDLVVFSIPSGLHSHKPPLIELLKDYVPSDARCLEIFARSLIPGWTSYGLEVLKLQHSVLFEKQDFRTF